MEGKNLDYHIDEDAIDQFVSWAHGKELCLDMHWDDRPNPYIDEETKLCYHVWCEAWKAFQQK